MALPGVTTDIVSGGTVADPGTNKHVVLGVCPKAIPNTLYGIGNMRTARSSLGDGQLAEACAIALQGGAQVYAMPLLPSVYGSVTSSLSLSGSGTATVVGSKGPASSIRVKIILGGARGTATFQVSIASGAWSATQTTAATYMVPGAYLTTLAFNTGTYVADDVYTLNTDGTVTRTGSGTATLLDASTHSPLDNYNIHVKVTTAGALGVGAFQYALDDGKFSETSSREYSYGGTIMIPSGGKYVIPDTGVVLTFAGTFVADDIYSGVATPAQPTNTDIGNAVTALRALSTQWERLHVATTPTSAANAAALAAILQTQMDTAEDAFRYAYAVMECPWDSVTDTDAVISAAFASTVANRVAAFVSHADIVSPLTSRIVKRPFGWAGCRRLAENQLCEDIGKTRNRALGGVTYIYRDENATPGLTEARFNTARTFNGTAGYYVTEGKTLASNGDDYARLANRRVMDLICTVAYAAYVLEVNSEVNITRDTGYIQEPDAQQIDSRVDAKLRAALTGQVSDDEGTGLPDIQSQIGRTDDLRSASNATAAVVTTPKGYLRNIAVTLSSANPKVA